ncbi:type IV secretion protein Rhs [Vibrio breoganii]|nr:type IV secretion protein Rhs [Vibrio breoganii]
MHDNIKNSAITAAGYIYQTRHGLKVLCDWLDAPARFKQVKFECDNDNEAPQGLDDIVIERTDGRFDLQQVKFTPRSDLHSLSWDWLLQKSGKTARSRSILRKWFDAYKKIEPNRLGDISLITNRVPDAEVEACLENGKISFTKIVEPNCSKVISELGGVAECEDFFSQLHVQHSSKGFESLEQNVDARLRAHGSSEGIATLKNSALNWATQQNFPYPDGWIQLTEVRTILRAPTAAPLPEDFAIPQGYEVPDETFHQNFVEETKQSVGKAVVLSGPPGRGKSTYLSALFERLAEEKCPTVRHHYYLSTTERGRDRVNSYVVEESIKAQIKLFHGDIPIPSGGLRPLLEACASYCQEIGKPFIVIIDGLDHVWRINAKDKLPLDDLFSQILPCPDNMVLLVGTQPVDDAQLPTDLLAVAPRSDWHTLPAMSENAVLSYLDKKVQEGKLTTNFAGVEVANEQLLEAAATLHKKTNGHPLHVIYATAELEHSGRKLSSWDVERLNGDLSENAAFYYGSLWAGLSASLKDTLRLICAFPFFWPKTAFSEIALVRREAQPDVGKVEHLLHSSEAGLKVFHESLEVYVRATAGYQARIEELMPSVADWLEKLAPASLRVNWLWTVQAKLGDPNNLIAGLTRDWIMLRFEEGYPESLFDTLLSDALAYALDSAMFSYAYRLAHLKDRMVGGSEFQMQADDKARLMSYTWALSSEDSVVREAFASRHETNILLLAALGLSLQSRGELHLAEKCGEELFRRLRAVSQYTHRYNSRSGEDEFDFIVSTLAKLNAIGATPEALSTLANERHSVIWLPRVQVLVEEANLDDLMAVASEVTNKESKNLISNACIRAAAFAGVSITERDDLNVLSRTPFVAAIEAALTRSSKPLNAPIPVEWQSADYYAQKEDLATLMHHWFFSAVHLGLSMAAEGQTDFDYVRAPTYENRRNITNFLNELSGIADKIAQHWWCGTFVDFHLLYEMLEPIEFQSFRQDYYMSSAAQDFRAALHRIACDIHLVSILLQNSDEPALSEDTLHRARACQWFDAISFREQYAAGSLIRMIDAAASTFIQSQRSLLETEVREETSVHLMAPLQLCAIALSHNLLPEARELCKQTWELTTGYGHRKDPTLSNTVTAIGYLVDCAQEDARRLLSQISPQIHHVLDYTDGKGTRHVLAETDRLLAKLKPSALVAKYEEHTYMGQWWQAENSLQAYVTQGIKDGWPLSDLMRTGLRPEVQETLQELALEGSTNAEKQLATLTEHLGWDIGVLHPQERSDSSTESEDYEGDPASFAPEQLNELLESVSVNYSYKQQKKFLRDWYEYWDANGQGKKLLQVLDARLLADQERHTDLLQLFELAFHTRRKLSGRKRAWKYLVRAQILNGGWSGYFESEEQTHNRLDLVSKHYSNRCDEFVSESTYGMFANPVAPRIAPGDVMVYFYVKQGRIKEAVNFAETMVNLVIEDTRTLPLEQPNWAMELSSPADTEA